MGVITHTSEGQGDDQLSTTTQDTAQKNTWQESEKACGCRGWIPFFLSKSAVVSPLDITDLEVYFLNYLSYGLSTTFKKIKSSFCLFQKKQKTVFITFIPMWIALVFFFLLNCGVGEDSWEPLARRSNQSILKEINPEYSLERLMLKLKLQYFGHLIWSANS